MTLTSGGRELRMAAIHEAGHAVVVHVCRFEPSDVSIAGEYFCRFRYDIPDNEPPGGISTPSREEVERDALVTLAGGKAENWYTGDTGIATLGATDDEYFLSLHPGDETPEALADWRQRMNLEAAKLVSRHWHKIEAVAQELLKRGGRLSGAEVHRIIAAETVSKSG